jgi:hypothetical protein
LHGVSGHLACINAPALGAFPAFRKHCICAQPTNVGKLCASASRLVPRAVRFASLIISRQNN